MKNNNRSIFLMTLVWPDNIVLNTWFCLQKILLQLHVSEDNLKSFLDFLGSNCPNLAVLKCIFMLILSSKKGTLIVCGTVQCSVPFFEKWRCYFSHHLKFCDLVWFCEVYPKGQLISKLMKQFDHSTVRQKKRIRSFVFWKNRRLAKKHYDFVWPSL